MPPPLKGDEDFSSPPSTHPFTAFLFDMDGTLIDSTPAIEQFWHDLGAQINVDPATILATSHGRRTIDTLGILAPHLANWDFILKAEAAIPRDHGESAVVIPGVRDLLHAVQTSSVPWATVTSGTTPLVQGWLDVLKLECPEVLVTAEQVAKGKPDPAPYRCGAEKLALGAEARKGVVVFEDAPSGVRSGKAAGFRVVALATSHTVERLREAGADWIVRDLSSVGIVGWDGGKGEGVLEIRDALIV